MENYLTQEIKESSQPQHPLFGPPINHKLSLHSKVFKYKKSYEIKELSNIGTRICGLVVCSY